jgi:ferredoxin
MPTVTFHGREIACESGARLRDVLLDAGESPHDDGADLLNCRGHGTCGTCAVEILFAGDGSAPDEGDEGDATSGEADGGASPVSEVGTRERARLSFPPHDLDAGLRLSCRTRVYGDVLVRKYPGFWGQHVDRDPE